ITLAEMYERGSDGAEKDEKKAFIWYLRAAEQDMYSTGRGTEQNNDEAARWYSQTTHQIQPDLSIGGVDVPQEVLQSRSGNTGSMAWYQKTLQIDSGEGGDKTGGIHQGSTANGLALARCQYEIGVMYLKGECGNQSESDAVKWLSKAADYGLAEAQFSLGSMYHRDQGVAQDENKSFTLYSQTAIQGYPPAQYECGYRHIARQSNTEGAKWSTMAAKQDSPMAQLRPVSMYEEGKGVVTDEDKAVKWFLVAAKQNHAGAQYMLGFMHENGQNLPQSDVLANAWYAKAADQDHPDAQFRLGWMYDKGRGVRQDNTKAMERFTKAAHQKKSFAQNALGWKYDVGQGVRQDQRLAHSWYSVSAAQDNQYAQFNLASMYELGIEVKMDSENALILFRSASRRREQNSELHVQWMTSQHWQSPLSASDLFNVQLSGAIKGYAAAQHNLGRLYEIGEGIRKNLSQAVIWYGHAAANGHMGAKDRLENLMIKHLDTIQAL
ncbi:hypothetical protein BGZ73_004218, partial [Actinomortierella ambigua]